MLTFSPCFISFWIQKFQGMKVPMSKSYREQKFQGAEVPLSESSTHETFVFLGNELNGLGSEKSM